MPTTIVVPRAEGDTGTSRNKEVVSNVRNWMRLGGTFEKSLVICGLIGSDLVGVSSLSREFISGTTLTAC